MIPTSPTPPIHRGPYILRDGVWQDVYLSKEDELPGLGSVLMQGAAVGAFLGCLSPVFGMLLHPENGYNYFYFFLLPLFFLIGAGLGLLEGVIIWGCSYIARHRLNVLVRMIITTVVLMVVSYVFGVLLADHSYENDQPDILIFIGSNAVYGAIFGLLIGARFHPLHELLRGTTPPQWPALTAITGFALRVIVIFSAVESALYVIWAEQGNREGFTLGVVALIHFLAAAVIVFARMPFWLLLLCAVIINLPVGVFIADLLREEQKVIRFLALNYLALWAAFLSCRFRLTEPALEPDR